MPIDVMYRVFTIVLGVYVAGVIVFRVCRLFWTGQWTWRRSKHSAGADGSAGSGDRDGDGSDAGGDSGGGDGGGD